MAMESLPMSFISARRRRLNSSRPMGRLAGRAAFAACAVPARKCLRRVLMQRPLRRWLLSACRRELDEQYLHADAYELDHLGERGFVFLVLFVGIDTHVRDLGEVVDDLAGLGGNLGRVRSRAGAQAVEEALAPVAECVGAIGQ